MKEKEYSNVWHNEQVNCLKLYLNRQIKDLLEEMQTNKRKVPIQQAEKLVRQLQFLEKILKDIEQTERKYHIVDEAEDIAKNYIKKKG